MAAGIYNRGVDGNNEILEICKYGEEVLKRHAREVTDIDQHLLDLIRRMSRTMYEAPGIGLAAPQVGESIRLFYSWRHTPALVQASLEQHHLRVLDQWITHSGEEGVFLACRG